MSAYKTMFLDVERSMLEEAEIEKNEALKKEVKQLGQDHAALRSEHDALGEQTKSSIEDQADKVRELERLHQSSKDQCVEDAKDLQTVPTNDLIDEVKVLMIRANYQNSRVWDLEGEKQCLEEDYEALRKAHLDLQEEVQDLKKLVRAAIKPSSNIQLGMEPGEDDEDEVCADTVQAQE